MKTRSYIRNLICIAAVALVSACGGESNTAVTGGTSQPAAAGEIRITGNDRMQFDRTEFTVKAGSEVVLTFHNIGRMPKETMGHNLVVLDKSVDALAFANASMQHAQTAYVAPDFKDRVIAATKILGPGEKETLTFTAPSEPGNYPFVCSFPGHTPAGMRGIMKVE